MLSIDDRVVRNIKSQQETDKIIITELDQNSLDPVFREFNILGVLPIWFSFKPAKMNIGENYEHKWAVSENNRAGRNRAVSQSLGVTTFRDAASTIVCKRQSSEEG